MPDGGSGAWKQMNVGGVIAGRSPALSAKLELPPGVSMTDPPL